MGDDAVQSKSCCVNSFVILWTVAHQAPLSMEFPRQEYRSRLPFASPGDLPHQGIRPRSPALAGRFFNTKPTSWLSAQFSCSVVFDSLRPYESQHARPPCPSPTPGVYLKLMSIESVMPSSYLILCRPLFLLPPIPPSIRVFSSESTLRMRWPKYWSFSFSISPSNEHPGLISFRMDWLDLLGCTVILFINVYRDCFQYCIS